RDSEFADGIGDVAAVEQHAIACQLDVDLPARRAICSASARSRPRSRAASVTARYIAPVSRKRNPRRRASSRAALLFPAPAGPSIVTIIMFGVEGRALRARTSHAIFLSGTRP